MCCLKRLWQRYGVNRYPAVKVGKHVGGTVFLGTIEFILFVIAVVFAGLWIANPSANYEPYAALFGLLFGGGVELLRRFKSPQVLSDHDRKLAQTFRGLFADSDLICLYQQHDFLLPLKREAVVPLNAIVETWKNESHYFVDKRLRAKQMVFVKAANELAHEIARYTVPDGNGYVSVITSQMDPENLPSHVRDEARAIDAKLPAFLRTHEELLALCNKLT